MANESDIPPRHAAEGETVTLPVYQEQLHVGTRPAATGRGVRVYKHVRSAPHQVDQTVWRDELDVRHVTVERFDDGNGGQPQSIFTKEATMAHTLAAVFEHRGDADRAKTELLNAGFDSSAVRLASGTSTQAGADDSIGSGGFMHFFSSLFGADDNADKQAYSSAINRGHTVLTVDADSDDEIDRAAEIIEGFGPLNIDEQQGLPGQAPQPQTYQGGQSAAAGSMQRTTTEQQAIPVIQEELKVGKRTVQRGGVRVYQRVVETPVREEVTLREEHVTVERHAVDQPIAPDQVPAFQEKSFELRENAEEAVVQKTARVVEEVVVGKEVSQRQDQISDTVRSTEVEVEQIAPDIDTHFRTHWQSNYATSGGRYEDYDPAYRYGSSMATNASYRGRPWDDVEPELRSNWESSYPQSAWEKFKAAVREGWDRMTS